MRVRFGVLLAVVGGMLSLGAAEASAAFERCRSEDSSRSCLLLTVPLDRSGAVPGTIRLHVERASATRAVRPPLVVVAGDPGHATNEVLDQEGGFLRMVGSERRSRDIVTIDLRGTGRSGKLRCPMLDRRGGDLSAAGAACAAKLGVSRAFYTSADAADDIDAVRQALGAPTIALYGSSYGSVVTQAYARKYPTHVERMVLDSVLPPEGVDPLARSSMAAAPRVLGSWCGGYCRWAPDISKDLERLARRLEQRPASGLTTNVHGRRHRERIAAGGLWNTLLAAGQLPFPLRPVIPGAIHNALRGDYAPLLQARRRGRLIAALLRDLGNVSSATRAATLCEESTFPWDRFASPAGRRGQTAAFVAALPPGTFGPFGPRTALHGELLDLCSAWPASTRQQATSGAPPALPTLLLAGGLDLRTPVESVRAVAARIPGSEVLSIANADSQFLRLGFSKCAISAVARFLAGGRAGRCPAGSGYLATLGAPPLALRELRQAGGADGRAGRTATAVMTTIAIGLNDVFTYGGLATALKPTRGSIRLRIDALRGGSFVLDVGTRIRLHVRDASYVPGVRVSGEISFGKPKRGGLTYRAGRLRVTGTAAARGSLYVRKGVVRGEIGGRRVRFRLDQGSQFLIVKSQASSRLSRLIDAGTASW